MDEKELVEKLAEAIWNHETAETIRREHKPANTQYAKWPTDSHRQPYCQSSYREAEALLPIIRAYVAERVAQAFSDGAAQHEKVWGAALMNEIANLKAHRTASVKTDNGWELTDYAYLCKLEGDVERLVEALRESRLVVSNFAAANPLWTYDGHIQDPSGAHALLNRIDAALALIDQPVAPKETK